MKTRILSAVLIGLCLTACNTTFEVGLEHAPAATSIPGSLPTNDPAAPGATATQLPPAPTSLQPTATALPFPTEAPFPTEPPAPTSPVLVHAVQIFLIAVNDNGQGGMSVGCGDSLIPVQVEITPTQGVLRAALEAMLALKSQYYGQSGLYNALYQSNLQVDSLSISNGVASVALSGSLKLGGECDNPRVQAQLEQTVLQFPTVTQAEITINGKPLKDALSLKG